MATGLTHARLRVGVAFGVVAICAPAMQPLRAEAGDRAPAQIVWGGSDKSARATPAGRPPAASLSVSSTRSAVEPAPQASPATGSRREWSYPDQPGRTYSSDGGAGAAGQARVLSLPDALPVARPIAPPSVGSLTPGAFDVRAAAERTRTEAAPQTASYVRSAPLTPVDVAPSRQQAIVSKASATSSSAAPLARARPSWLEVERVGAPYTVAGKTYVPTPEPNYVEEGIASWYGSDFHGKPTATGEIYDMTALTAAHPTLPIPSLAQVTNLANGREVIVRINDRGPFVGDRLIDLSQAAADQLGYRAHGTAKVVVRYLGPAPRKVAARPEQSAAQPPQPVRLEPARPVTANGGPVLLPSQTALTSTSQATPQSQAPALGGTARSGAVYIQIGAFSDIANAHRARNAAGDVGEAIVQPIKVSGAELFRVLVGPRADKAEAETLRLSLLDAGFSGARTVVMP